MPFGVELWICCVITMVRHLRSGVTVSGEGEVGGVRPKRRGQVTGNMMSEIRAAVEEYREGQKRVVKLTFKDLQAKYNIPASTIRGYFNKDPSGQKAVVHLVMGRKCVLPPPQGEQKLVDYLLKYCDRGYGKTRG